MIWDSLCRRLRLPVSPDYEADLDCSATERIFQPGLEHFSDVLEGRLEIPLSGNDAFDGIISYLTEIHGGNVHEKGVVNITSRSVFDDNPDCAPKYVVDMTEGSHWFSSAKQPGQWICWDFRRRRLSPDHYTIWAVGLKSWVLEGSVDGAIWTEIDRQTDNFDFAGDLTSIASFAASSTAEYRFIRLTQTDSGHTRDDSLNLRAVEFFGTIFE
jgi:hypothetical protein